MPCYYPLDVMYTQGVSGAKGTIKFNASLKDCNMKLPCGQCVGCKERRARDWALRVMHEASLWSDNCFITLTYDDEFVPEDMSLKYSDFQEFMKRLRFHYKGLSADAEGHYPIRFYMAGEYGENFGRPHFHACIFNFQFDDLKFFKKTGSGQVLYRSAKLEELWPFGYSTVGTVTFESAAYVARYINKKVKGSLADDHYAYVMPDTGEVVWREPEFNRMSLKPGIGSAWLDKFKSDVFPRDYVVYKGAKLPVPRYYAKKFECSNPFEWDEVKHERYLVAQKQLDDNTPDRLRVKETVHKARLSRLKRTLT